MNEWTMGRQVMLAVLLWGTVLTASAQESREGLKGQLTTAFEQGNMKALIDRAAPQVEIGLFGESKLYSRAQALFVLESFRTSFPPERFVVRDESVAERGWFLEGFYWSGATRSPLRVYLRLRVNDGQWEIREVLIERRDAP